MTRSRLGPWVAPTPLKVFPDIIPSCDACPYAMPCYQGHFYNNDRTMDRFTTYCPGCEVLRYQYLPENVLEEADPKEMLSIRCDIRNNEGFVRESMVGWNHDKSLVTLPMLFETLWEGKMTLQTPDPGPTSDTIHVAACARCCEYNEHIENKRQALETYAAELRHKMWTKGEFY